jgi:hypothetical protein
MADYRSVQTRMWREDEWFQELDVEARLFWIYLFTNPSASPAGIYRLPLRTMAFESGVDYETAQDLMRQFAAIGKARYEDGVVWVVNMRRLQFPTLIDGSKEWQTAVRIQRDIDLIPDRCALKAQYLAHSGYPTVYETMENGKPVKRVSIQYPGIDNTVVIPHPCPIDTPSVNSNSNITERNVTQPADDDFRSVLIGQYSAVMGMFPTASYPEAIGYMDRLKKGDALDWWQLAITETVDKAKRPSWQYMKSILESWLAAGHPSTASKNGTDPGKGKQATGTIRQASPDGSEWIYTDIATGKVARREPRETEELF